MFGMVGVVELVRGLGNSCGVWCMSVDWIVMVCSGGCVCVCNMGSNCGRVVG